MTDQLWGLLLLIASPIALLYLAGLVRHFFFDRSIPKPLTDSDILRVAQEGDLITAIRWYRTLHVVKLGAAREAVKAMLDKQPPPASADKQA